MGRGTRSIHWPALSVHEDVHSRRFFGPPKGGCGRSIDLPLFLADHLARHAERIGDRDLLFVNRRGAPIRHTDFLRMWRPACDGGFPRYGRDGRILEPAKPPICLGLRFHDLRHTHKTMLIELDVPEVLQDERLGHHPPGMRTVYAHTTPAMRTTMIAGLEMLWLEVSKRREPMAELSSTAIRGDRA
jgi:integrase